MKTIKITPFNVAVIAEDTHLSKWIEEKQRLDCDEFCNGVCERFLKPGMVVVDGGASLGDHTLAYLNAVGPTGRVLAFEANHDTYRCLIHNCPKAEVHLFGLGEKESVQWLVPHENIGASYVLPERTNESYEIRIVPLDKFELPRLDLLKLDVEGMEFEALKGAIKTIDRCRPIILLEINDSTAARRGTNRNELIAYLEDHGYQLESKDTRSDMNESQIDVLFLPT